MLSYIDQQITQVLGSAAKLLYFIAVSCQEGMSRFGECPVITLLMGAESADAELGWPNWGRTSGAPISHTIKFQAES